MSRSKDVIAKTCYNRHLKAALKLSRSAAKNLKNKAQISC
jgi:hypothetical protein